MNERDKARRALDHALAALTDGAGDGRVWGPGVVLDKLTWLDGYASNAFGIATGVAYRCGAREPEEFIRVMPLLAHPILEAFFALAPEEEP